MYTGIYYASQVSYRIEHGVTHVRMCATCTRTSVHPELHRVSCVMRAWIVVVFAPFSMCIPIHACIYSFQCASVVPHARGLLALAMGFRPVAKDRLSMTHCKPFKKIKPNFFLGLALKTCIEGNCIEKARFIAIKPVKSRVYGGCKNFHQFSQNKCLVCGMTLISRGHQFFK